MITFERRLPKEIQHDYDYVSEQLKNARQTVDEIVDERNAALQTKVRMGMGGIALFVAAIVLALLGWFFSLNQLYSIGFMLVGISSLVCQVAVERYNKHNGSLDARLIRAKERIEHYRSTQLHLLVDLRIAQTVDPELVRAVINRTGI